MAYDFEEQEKLDSLRDWWSRYGTLCVIVACLAAAAVLGWRGWQWYEQNRTHQAMGYFEALQRAAQQSDSESNARLLAASQTLQNDYGSSAYTSRGVLIAGTTLHKQGDLDAAQQQFEWLVQHSKDPAMVPVAQLRLATVLAEKKEFDQALAQLTSPPAAFEGLYLDRQGDIWYTQQDTSQALAAWRQAKEHTGEAPLAELIQLKIDAIEE